MQRKHTQQPPLALAGWWGWLKSEVQFKAGLFLATLSLMVLGDALFDWLTARPA